jgi:hypothetical protein
VGHRLRYFLGRDAMFARYLVGRMRIV